MYLALAAGLPLDLLACVDAVADALCICAQSTLMRAIANGQVDGFPSKDELRTVYVEHDIDGESGMMSVVNYVLADPTLKGELCALPSS